MDIYEEEKTILESNIDNTSDNKPKDMQKDSKVWKTVTMGGVTGIALGAVAALIPGEINGGELPPVLPSGVTELGGGSTVAASIPVAHGVSDNMSFADAFDCARIEVGPGGVFVWHDYVYSTYTEEEWGGMTETQHNEFGDHIHWVGETSDDNVHESGKPADSHAPAHTEMSEEAQNLNLQIQNPAHPTDPTPSTEPNTSQTEPANGAVPATEPSTQIDGPTPQVGGTEPGIVEPAVVEPDVIEPIDIYSGMPDTGGLPPEVLEPEIDPEIDPELGGVDGHVENTDAVSLTDVAGFVQGLANGEGDISCNDIIDAAEGLGMDLDANILNL